MFHALLLLLTPVQPVPEKAIEPPIVFDFQRMSGPADGRKQAFDAKTQTYHLKVHDIAKFSVKSVAGDLEKRRIVLHITGMLDRPEGPLKMHVPLDGGGSKEYVLHHSDHDQERFRITRKDQVTTIEFLPKGRSLLKTGVWFQYIDFYRN